MSIPSNPNSKTRVAVVGAGFIAEFHLEILAGLPEVEVACVCDPVLRRAEGIAKRHGVPRAVASVKELAELDIQVAHVLVPPDLHEAVTRECLEAGLGVFLEKPMVLESEVGRALLALAEERGLALGVNHNSLFHPSFKKVLEDVRAGAIGRVEHVQVTLSVPLRQLDAGQFSHWMFRRPHHIVFEQAPHPLAQCLELIGPVKSARTTLLGTRELLPGQPFHDRWLVAARAERGTAEIYLAFGQDFTRNTLQVLGTDGSRQVDLFHDHLEGEGKTQWLDFWNSFLAGWRRGGMLRRSARGVLFNWMRQTLGLGPREDAFFAGMRGAIGDFHRGLRSGADPRGEAKRAIRVIEWCEALCAEVPNEVHSAPAPPEPGPPREGEVVVLGATGFIGKRTVAALLERDVPVTVVARRTHSLPPILVDGLADGRIRFFRASLEDPGDLAPAFAGARSLIHLATGGGDRWEDVQRAMVEGSRTVAKAAQEAGVQRFVYVSTTAALYLGRDCGSAVVEDDVGTDPQPDGRSLYARGKIAAEEALFALQREGGLPLTVVRPGVVLGPGTPLQHSGLGLWVRDNHCVGWGHGRHPLPLVLADDVADLLARAALHEGPELDGRALNLAAKVGLSGEAMVAAMRARTGRALEFHPRSLYLSQAMEIGKWIVKRVGGRKVAFPSWRDLKSRELFPILSARTARELLGWQPVEDPATFLDRALAEATPQPAAEPEEPALVS